MRHFTQFIQIDLHVEVARVTNNSSVFHHFEVFFAQHVDVAGQRAEKIRDRRGLSMDMT